MNGLIGQGLVLMVVGMGVVFGFLALLVYAMSGSAAFFKRFAHLFPEEQLKQPGVRKAAEDHSEIAVAIAAIKTHTGS